ncbi:hypothetical protein [Massilia rubra]|uniref:hypothetical protein n=1 Tax=Massilia rubra TaxID=2607910 RepID=UPI001421A965|nr:hypothetical protein [Massilia rubra]
MASQATTIRVNTAYLHTALDPIYREAMLGEHEAELALLDLRKPLYRQLYVEEIVAPLFAELAPPTLEKTRQALKYLLHVPPGPGLAPACQLFGVALSECVPLLNLIWSVLFPDEDREIPAGWRYVDRAKSLNYHQTRDFYSSSPQFLDGAWERLEARLCASLNSSG